MLGVSIGWVDNNGIVRSRTVPTAELAAAVRRGVGITAVFAVFDSHDGITFAHEGSSTPSGDVRLVPVVDGPAGVVPLAGQPGLAWVPGRQLAADGSPWPYDQRSVLERQVERAAEAGFEVRAGFEVEMVVDPRGRGVRAGAPRAGVLRQRAARRRRVRPPAARPTWPPTGSAIGQLHAEYGESQVELALEPLDALAACDAQVLARQTIHSAARAHGLRVELRPGHHRRPVPATAGTCTPRWSATARNALTGDDEHGLSPTGRGYVAGLLRELPGIVAVTAPSTGSLLRRRPGYWAGAYGFWGVENREAALRLVPSSTAARARAHQRRAEGVRRLGQPLPRAGGR